MSFSHDVIADTSKDRSAKNEPRKRARQRFAADVRKMLGKVAECPPDGPDDLFRMRAEMLLGRPAQHGLTSASALVWPTPKASKRAALEHFARIERIAKMLRESLHPVDRARASWRSIAIAVLVEAGMEEKDAENAVDRA